jgi:hypothetical protein
MNETQYVDEKREIRNNLSFAMRALISSRVSSSIGFGSVIGTDGW